MRRRVFNSSSARHGGAGVPKVTAVAEWLDVVFVGIK